MEVIKKIAAFVKNDVQFVNKRRQSTNIVYAHRKQTIIIHNTRSNSQ